MINWFDMPAEGLSNGGLFEVKELEVTENGTYETKGEMYNKVTVNVEGGGGSSDFSTAEITIINNSGATVTLGDIIAPTFQVTSDFKVVNLDTEIANNETLVLDLLTPIDLSVGWIASVFLGLVTNMINSTVDEDGCIFITDPLQNSSCTITIS